MKEKDYEPHAKHLLPMGAAQARKRRQAACGLLAGAALAAVGFIFFPAFLFPAGAVMGWFAKAFLDSNVRYVFSAMSPQDLAALRAGPMRRHGDLAAAGESVRLEAYGVAVVDPIAD